MGIVIGIDVGISTTKIVGIKNNKVSAPIRITAADPITSLYGAFGKYLHDNDIELKDVEHVMLTGVGAANKQVAGVYRRWSRSTFRVKDRPCDSSVDGHRYNVHPLQR